MTHFLHNFSATYMTTFTSLANKIPLRRLKSDIIFNFEFEKIYLPLSIVNITAGSTNNTNIKKCFILLKY